MGMKLVNPKCSWRLMIEIKLHDNPLSSLRYYQDISVVEGSNNRVTDINLLVLINSNKNKHIAKEDSLKIKIMSKKL